MRMVRILVEGQTEEIIVNQVLAPEFMPDTCLEPTVLKTKRLAGGGHFKGGVTSWARIENDIRRLLGDTHATYVTTLIDYYGLPVDTPGMSERPEGTPYDRVEYVERAISSRVSDPRFIANLVLHETEAWVLAAAQQLGELLGDAGLAENLDKQVRDAGSAELVNDGPHTAPSKRLLTAFPGYNKTQDGPTAISDLGITALRSACPHLDRWLALVLS